MVIFGIKRMNFQRVLFCLKGHIVLTDFGLCKEGIETSGTTSTFCGTPEVCTTILVTFGSCPYFSQF